MSKQDTRAQDSRMRKVVEQAEWGISINDQSPMKQNGIHKDMNNQYEDKQSIIALIESVYQWFNQIADKNFAFKKEDLKKFFTTGFIMQLNDEIIVEGHSSLFEHFEKFRNSDYKMNIRLPLKEIFVSEDGDKCVARYSISKISADQTVQDIKVIAIWHITNKLLSRMNEVVFFDLGERQENI